MLVLWLEEVVLGQFLLLLACLVVRPAAVRVSRRAASLLLVFLAGLGPSSSAFADAQQQHANFADRIVDAVNCGGPSHKDSHGIVYRKDPLEGRQGIASDHGRQYLIQRVSELDRPLYQTERYDYNALEYKINVPDDGQYVLVLKFSEVYFEAANLKVFDVFLNDEHHVMKELDIFSSVGKAVAHDELVDFEIRNSRLVVGEHSSPFSGELLVQLRKGRADNPKLNALYVLRGRSTDVPKLPSLQQFHEQQRLARRLDVEEEEEDVDEEVDVDQQQQLKKTKRRKTADEEEEERRRREKLVSGRKMSDPYAQQDHSQMFLPILIALAAFFPVLFCLCKL